MMRLLSIAVLAALAGACAPMPGPAADPVDRLLAIDPQSPSWNPVELPPSLRHHLAGLFAPSRAADEEPLDTLVLRLSTEHLGEPQEPPPPAVDRTEALKAYAEGRSRLLDGDVAGAVVSLTRATQLDPGSSEAWRELAEAQLRSGARQSSYRSFQRAVELGMDDARSLELLGRFAGERGEGALAARLFARAMRGRPEEADPALPYVLAFEFAQTIDGGSRAALEALRRAAEIPEEVLASTGYRAEVAAIIQQRPRLWVELGDESARRREPAEADRCYHAAMQGAPDPMLLIARRIVVQVSAGRPGRGAVLFLAALAQNPSLIPPCDERAVALGAILGASAAGPIFREQLGEIELPPSASLAAWLLRVKAAAEPPSRARPLLVQALARAPDSRSALADWAGTIDPRDGPRALRLGTGLLASDVDALAVASVLVDRVDAKEAADAVRGARGDDRIVAAMMSLRLDDPARAAALLGEAPVEALGAEYWLARARIAAAMADWGMGEGAVAALGGDARRAAIAFALLQRFPQGLGVIAPGNDSGSADSRSLLIGSELALGLGEADRAERWLRAALELDPHDERAHERLVALYAPQGGRADSGKLSESIQAARRSIPDSRLVRSLIASELLQRALHDAAWIELLRLVEEQPGDPEVHPLVLRAMQVRANPEDEAWVRAFAGEHPNPDAPVALLARWLRQAGEDAAGEECLRRRLADRASHALARLLEEFVRSDPARAGEADALALARLERTPRSIDASLELAAVLADGPRAGEVPGLLGAALPRGITMVSSQAEHLSSAMESLADAAPRTFLEACRVLIDRGIILRAPWHQHRLEVLSESHDASALLAAVDDALEQHPGLDLAPYGLVTSRLVALKRADVAADFAIAAALARDKPELWLDAYRVVGLIGGGAHARRLIDGAVSAGAIPRLLADVLGPEAEPITGTEAAEVAYQAANFAWEVGREPASLEMFRLALELDPSHAWANNNLGYFLLETGGDLGEAERYLELAYQKLPDNPSVLDSLGWLRYLQGRLEDNISPGFRRMGAVTLLRLATSLPEGRVNPTILDHYADALWAAGQREAAQRYWISAEARALQRVEVLSQNPGGGEPEARDRGLKEFRDKAATIREKIEAAKNGEAPRLGGPASARP